MDTYDRGSEWRRWDLHVHTKDTAKADDFKSQTFDQFCVALFEKALESNIACIGITDYFNTDNYERVRQFVSSIESRDSFTDLQKQKIQSIFLLPNIELRLPASTGKGRAVNLHCLFNPEYVPKLNNSFFGTLEFSWQGESFKMNRQGLSDLGQAMDQSLSGENAYKRGLMEFLVTPDSLYNLISKDWELRENLIIVVSNSNNDGASGINQHHDLFEQRQNSSFDALRQAIYKLSDAVFSSNPKDIEYFTGLGVDDPETVVRKCGSLKPCFHGSDAHTEEKLFSPDNNRYLWIKADPSFSGLLQILYEPVSGERVFIGPSSPDPKDSYKVVDRIEFQDEENFPESIVFNSNLTSIIGSRSSGKSALLAYLADSIDTIQARKHIGGPGEGILWSDIEKNYKIYWKNGETNEESPGKVIYIPQNHLFSLSGNRKELKEKIRPVLFNRRPDIGAKVVQTEKDLSVVNENISISISNWFEENEKLERTIALIKDLGARRAVEKEKGKADRAIGRIRGKYSLSNEELKGMQEISDQLETIEGEITQANEELDTLGDGNEDYFKSANVTLSPPYRQLPDDVSTKIEGEITRYKQQVLAKANKTVLEYVKALITSRTVAEKKLAKLQRENKTLIDKYQKNQELEELVKRSSDLQGRLSKIDKQRKIRDKTKDNLRKLEEQTILDIGRRTLLLSELEQLMNKSEQTERIDMSFGIETGFSDSTLEEYQKRLNLKEKSDFVVGHKMDLSAIRDNSVRFLKAIADGSQKIARGKNAVAVVIDLLTLTEEIMFFAVMEGDRIGGFTDSTMTPGKRALFALRLLLAESTDTWPLLIDQPEDDLDSRSIFDEIVPFLKDKKRERQIIMVSHNANLVISSDSEQIIVANRHGGDRPNQDGMQFNYFSGSIENSKPLDKAIIDTLKAQGIKEHACSILEGGETAFSNRSKKYKIQ